MKKALAMLLALVMVLGLCACGSGDTKTTAAPAPETTAAATTQAETTAAKTTAAETTAAETTAVETTAPDSGAMSYAEYAAAQKGDEVVIEAYVQDHQSWWDNQICVYLQDKDGAYFAYNMACSEADAERLVPGSKILVTGFKDEWGGEFEITDATFEFAMGADTYIAEPKDVTAELSQETLINSQNMLVGMKGLVVEPYDESGAAFAYKNAENKTDDLYIKFSQNGQLYEFCVEYYLRGNDTEVYKTVENLKVGDIVDVEGFLYWYYGPNTHLTKVSVTGNINDKSEGVMSYEEYIAAADQDEVVIEAYVQDTQSWWEDKITVYLQDADGGYFVYEMECSEEDAKKLVPGTKIRVTGFMSPWSGEVEIGSGATFEFVDDGISWISQPQDLTALLGTEEMIKHQNVRALLKGLTVEAYDETGAAFAYKNAENKTDDLYLKLYKDGKSYEFCVEYYLRNEATDVYQAVEALEVGKTVDVECYLYWYNDMNPHVIGIAESEAE